MKSIHSLKLKGGIFQLDILTVSLKGDWNRGGSTLLPPFSVAWVRFLDSASLAGRVHWLSVPWEVAKGIRIWPTRSSTKHLQQPTLLSFSLQSQKTLIFDGLGIHPILGRNKMQTAVANSRNTHIH